MLKLILSKALVMMSIMSAVGCSKKQSDRSDYLFYNIELKSLEADAGIRGTLPQKIDETIVSVLDEKRHTTKKTYHFCNNKLTDIITDRNHSIRFEYNEDGKISCYTFYRPIDKKDRKFETKYVYTYNNESALTQKDIYKNDADTISESWMYFDTNNKTGIYIKKYNKTKHEKYNSYEYQIERKGKQFVGNFKIIDIRYKQEHVIMHRQDIRDKDFKLVKTTTILSGNKPVTKYTYNKEGFIKEIDEYLGDMPISIVSSMPNITRKKITFEYEYDEKGNWIQCIRKTDGKTSVTTTRKILY